MRLWRCRVRVEAGKVRLLNGDMVTPAAFGACIGKIDERLDGVSQSMALLTAEVTGINQRLDRMDAYPRRWLYVGLLLGVLLIVAQVGTPFLERGADPSVTSSHRCDFGIGP